jgi:hypothetical protein
MYRSNQLLLAFVWRVFWALLILTAFLGSGSGCGAVSVDWERDSSVDGSETNAESFKSLDAGMDGAEDRETAQGNLPETHPPIDAGVSLPICPPEIMSYDCPQPKCDCRDR